MTFRLILAWLVLTAALSLPAEANLLQSVGAVVSGMPSGPVPTITPGTTTIGAAQTCNYGTWTGTPTPTTSNTWNRNGTPISGQTSTGYTIATADQGTALTCVVTGSNSVGSTSQTSAALNIPAAAQANGQWSLTDKDASITVSTTTTANDTATGTNGSGFKSIRATGPSYTVGTNHNKVIAQYYVNTASQSVNAGDGTLIGILGGPPLSLGSHIGAVNPGVGIEGAGSGDYINNAAPVHNCSDPGKLNFHSGQYVYLAIDFNSGKLWCSADCINWPGGGNPDSGSGAPITLANGTGPYFMGWSGGNFTGGPDKVLLPNPPNLSNCATNASTFGSWVSGGPSGILHVQDNYGLNNATNQTTATVTLNNPSAVGNSFVVLARGQVTTGTASSINVTTTPTMTCTHPPGTFSGGGSSGAFFTTIWVCPNVPSAGTYTFNATYNTSNSNLVSYPNLLVGEFSGMSTSAPDAGVGNGVNLTGVGSGSPASISTSGSVTQVGDLVVSVMFPSASDSTGFGTGQTAFTSITQNFASYSISGAAGTITHTYNYGSPNSVTGSIAAFTHP